MTSPVATIPDRTLFATADEIHAFVNRTEVIPPIEPVPTKIQNTVRKVPVLRRRASDNSYWLPDTHHDYYASLDHGVRPETRGIVLHVNVGYYDGTLNYFRAQSNGVGAHFEIGFQKGQATQLLPIDRLAWHAVAANAFSIGIEHAGFGRTRTEWLQNHDLEIRYSANRAAWILHRYDLGRPERHKNIFYHSDGGAAWGGHQCPGVAFPYDVWHSYCLAAYLNHWGRG